MITAERIASLGSLVKLHICRDLLELPVEEPTISQLRHRCHGP